LQIALSYQTFGKELGEAPIVLVNHALTANANVAGANGWWKELIGENKCIDTEVYTILAFNVPGNGSDNNEIKDYKSITTRDVAQLFLLGLEALHIKNVFAVIGGSTGGGVAWEMVFLNSKLFKHLIPIASDWKATDWVIANCHIQDAILNNSSQPLFDARMHAMTLYRTPACFSQKFNRLVNFKERFLVENWLDYHGNALSKRFTLAAYKLMNQLLRTVDITKGRGTFLQVGTSISSHIHIISVNSDLLFKPEECYKTYRDLKELHKNVTYHEIDSIHGHDAFLIEYDQLSAILHSVFSRDKTKASPAQTICVKA